MIDFLWNVVIPAIAIAFVIIFAVYLNGRL